MTKRTPLLTIWALSFAALVLTANEMGCTFWLALTAFACTSLHIEKHRRQLEKE